MTEMEKIAEAAYYIQDVLAGRIGSFTIEEEGWGQGDAERCLTELRGLLAHLDSEWKRDDKAAWMAPYTGNVKRAVFTKTFEKPIGKRWVVVTFTERFGIHIECVVHPSKPW